jgi:hypothetical protein
MADNKIGLKGNAARENLDVQPEPTNNILRDRVLAARTEMS